MPLSELIFADMPHRISMPQCTDAVVIALGSAVSAIIPNLLLAESISGGSGSNGAADLRTFLLPLLGAVLASGSAFLLNPQVETRKIVFGRCLWALMAGTLSPDFIGWIHPSLDSMLLRDKPLMALGAASATLAYIISRPLCAKFYEKADADAARIAAELERRLLPPIAKALVENTVATKENTAQRSVAARVDEASTAAIQANTSVQAQRVIQEAGPRPVSIVNPAPIPVTLSDSQPIERPQ